LNATYRDVRYVVPFFVQLWMFVTPVIYPTSAVITRLESMGIPGWLYALNPMVGVVEGFRWTLLGSPLNVFPILAASSATSAALLVTGVTHFRKMERAIADVI
jgi:lipopolysaccharide transport system permease protein